MGAGVEDDWAEDAGGLATGGFKAGFSALAAATGIDFPEAKDSEPSACPKLDASKSRWLSIIVRSVKPLGNRPSGSSGCTLLR